ncbi:MAG: hypothetical protein ACOVOX_02495 [Burkholderiaceae bacterium]
MSLAHAPTHSSAWRTPRAAWPTKPMAAGELQTDVSGTLLVYLMLVSPALLAYLLDPAGVILCAGAALLAALAYIGCGLMFSSQRDISGYVLIPLWISATQNLYLGAVAERADALSIQVSLLAHLVYAVGLVSVFGFVLKANIQDPLVKVSAAVALALLLFGVVSVALLHAPMVAMVTSARNMITPAVFLLLGLLVAQRVRQDHFTRFVVALAWLTITFGLVEYVLSEWVWGLFNIDTLWIKKGIPNLAHWGLPANFVSSERFFGEQIRRMASSYADPVNFGTVVFFFFMLAWYARHWVLVIFCLLAIALAISKGALLGLLIFFTVWAHYFGGRFLFICGAVLASVLGAALVGYTLLHSTQSLLTHVHGLVAAITGLPAHPFGRGLGGVGVLAEGSDDIRESGLGLIIGQLGLLAFVVFGTFFVAIAKRLPSVTDVRERVLVVSLFYAIFFNIAFNEVALSPNSCAGYFLLLGIVLGRSRTENISVNKTEANHGPGYRHPTTFRNPLLRPPP